MWGVDGLQFVTLEIDEIGLTHSFIGTRIRHRKQFTVFSWRYCSQSDC